MPGPAPCRRPCPKRERQRSESFESDASRRAGRTIGPIQKGGRANAKLVEAVGIAREAPRFGRKDAKDPVGRDLASEPVIGRARLAGTVVL